MNRERVRKLNHVENSPGPVIYWMSRDQRVYDNRALLYAQGLAKENRQPLLIIFAMSPEFLGAALRQYDFMIRGLMKVESKLQKLNIPFYVLTGSPEEEVIKFCDKNKAGALVTDFDPLRLKRKWKDTVAGKIKIPFYEADAHNIIPCWKLSDKAEFGAYTIRPRIHRLLPEFLEEYPLPEKMNANPSFPPLKTDWDRIYSCLKIDNSVKPVGWIKPGEDEALAWLEQFLESRLHLYKEKRNDPNENAQSGLSAYLHFGQLSAARAALRAERYKFTNLPAAEAFLEELIVRRELSDNYCFYNPDYDSFKGFPSWAKKTLNEHRKDKRLHVYTTQQLENALTHDELWNAAQRQMLSTGRMHGYMRMYWAKKILEWTPSPEEAQEAAIYLNDKYELDGRDPNGYTGIAWSIGGVHDRAWGEREVFGKIRYMNYNGCKRKFDVKKYAKTFANVQ